jgi:hypothetical protein
MDWRDGVYGRLLDEAANALRASLDLDGQLNVNTVGSPQIGSQWPLISGFVRNGQFSSFDFGGVPYAWHYTGDGITLMRMGLNPCAQTGQGWGCIPYIVSPPSTGSSFTWRGRPLRALLGLDLEVAAGILWSADVV